MKESLRRIRAVFAREFFSLAASAALWVFLVIFLVLIGVFTFVFNNILELGQADPRPFFNSMPLLFLFAVPALGMPMWSDEKRNGTFELNLSYPCTVWELVAGKYLAGMLILFSLLVFTLGKPVTLMILGKPDISSIVCGYAGALMAGSVFLAVTAFCSAMTRSQTASFLISLLFCALLLFSGNDLVTAFISRNIAPEAGRAVEFFSLAPHYLAFQRGLIDTSEIAYAVFGTLFFLYLARSVLIFSASGAGSFPGALSDAYTWRQLMRLALRMLGALFVFSCLLYSAQVFSSRFDFTGDKAYSLTPEALSLSSSLKRDVSLTLYISPSSDGMPSELQQYASRVRWLLDEFVKASDGRIRLKVVEPKPDSVDEELARIEGVRPVKNEAGERFFFGITFSSGAKTLALPTLSALGERSLEYDIVRSILNVTRASKPRVGVMSAFTLLPKDATRENPTGKTDGWYAFRALENDFDFVEIPLDVLKIPSDIDALVVLHPSGISERALYAVDQYIMHGGRVAFFIDPMSMYARSLVQRDTSFIEKYTSDISRLTKAWGVEVLPETAAADLKFKESFVTREGLRTTNPMVMTLDSSGINRENPLTSELGGIRLRYAGVIDNSMLKDGIYTDALLFTSPRSLPVACDAMPEKVFDDLGNMKEPSEPLVLAARYRGNFRSGFTIPPDPAVSTEDFRHKSESVNEDAAEVFLFADSDMLFRDSLVRQVQDEYGRMTFVPSSENLILFQNILEQLCGEGGLSSLRSRVPMSRPLTAIDEARTRAELAFSDKVKGLYTEFMRTKRSYELLKKHIAANPAGVELTSEHKELLGTYALQEAEFKREIQTARASLRSDLDSINTRYRFINIIAVPLCVMLLGLLWGALRRIPRRHAKPVMKEDKSS